MALENIYFDIFKSFSDLENSTILIDEIYINRLYTNSLKGFKVFGL